MNNADLDALYPFLAAPKSPEGDELVRELSASIAEKARASREANERFVAACSGAILSAAEALASSFRGGGRLFTIGNGGSSCDAAHIAVEFLHPVTAGRPALPAIDLTADVATLTALSNDIGYENALARALAAHARKGDALIGVSTSGNSENLLCAFNKARELGVVTIAFTGTGGGRLAAPGIADHVINAPSDSVHRVQECHVVGYHILWDLVHTRLARTPASP